MVKRTRTNTNKAVSPKLQKTAEITTAAVTAPTSRRTRNQASNSAETKEEPKMQEVNAVVEVIEVKDEVKNEQNNGKLNGDDQEQVAIVTEEAQKSPEEIKDLLDSLSRAHPYGLLRNASRLARRMIPKFSIEKSKVDKDEKSETQMTVEAHYINHVLNVKGISGNNEKFAIKIVSDLFLEILYPNEHELDERTVELKENNLTVASSIDDGWYPANCENYNSYLDKKVKTKTQKIQDSAVYTEEEKLQKIAKIELEKEPAEPTYDEIYRAFDNPFFKVFHNVCTGIRHKHLNLSYEVDCFKTVDGVEIQMPKHGKKKQTDTSDDTEQNTENPVNEETKEQEADVDLNQTADTTSHDLSGVDHDTPDNEPDAGISGHRIIITVNQNDTELFKIEHVDKSCIYFEARSEAAYLVLEQLMTDGIVKEISRHQLKRQNAFYSGKTGNSGKRTHGSSFRGRNSGKRGKGGRGGSRNQNSSNRNKNSQGPSPKKNPKKENKKESPVKKQVRNCPAPEEYFRNSATPYQVHNQSFPAGQQQQMMMVPVMMQPNGQMMIMPNQGQQMMMMPSHNQNNTNSQSNFRGRGNKRGRGGNRGRGNRGRGRNNQNN